MESIRSAWMKSNCLNQYWKWWSHELRLSLTSSSPSSLTIRQQNGYQKVAKYQFTHAQHSPLQLQFHSIFAPSIKCTAQSSCTIYISSNNMYGYMTIEIYKAHVKGVLTSHKRAMSSALTFTHKHLHRQLEKCSLGERFKR